MDLKALELVPRGKMPNELRNCFPVGVYGDGHCLPRAGSVLCFGHENFHQEIRCRITIEMCCFKDKYIDNEYLCIPQICESEAKSLVKTYAMFSNEYTPGDRLTDAVIRRIFEAESLNIRKHGEFMGIWQMFALSSILKTRLYSIYPECGPDVAKKSYID